MPKFYDHTLAWTEPPCKHKLLDRWVVVLAALPHIYVPSKTTVPLRLIPCRLLLKRYANHVHHANATAQQAVLAAKACTTTRQGEQV